MKSHRVELKLNRIIRVSNHNNSRSANRKSFILTLTLSLCDYYSVSKFTKSHAAKEHADLNSFPRFRVDTDNSLRSHALWQFHYRQLRTG